MEPDGCTSATCESYGGDYCPRCSHGIFVGSGTGPNGRAWQWEFNTYFGPLFVTKEGEPLKRQPIGEDHQVWPLFEAWHEKHKKRIGET